MSEDSECWCIERGRMLVEGYREGGERSVERGVSLPGLVGECEEDMEVSICAIRWTQCERSAPSLISYEFLYRSLDSIE